MPNLPQSVGHFLCFAFMKIKIGGLFKNSEKTIFAQKEAMKFITILILSIFISATIAAQHETKTEEIKTIEMTALPYHQIPEAPEMLNAATVLSRMVDGLGYRYYWATDSLRVEDLAWKPGDDGKTIAETLDHLYGLSLTIINGARGEANIRPIDWSHLTTREMRNETLKNLKAASDHFRAINPDEIGNSKVIFQRGENTSEFPLWNLINGPIADAIYHTGQIVAFRRAAGNPVDSGMNVFIGKTKGKN